MNTFIKQCKGKDLTKIPKSRLGTKLTYFAGIKYDGNYVQIHKHDNKVKFFTSSGKEFYLPRLSELILAAFRQFDFIIETEYQYNSQGVLGDRRLSAKLTTYRTQFNKGLISVDSEDDLFRIFDIIYLRKQNQVLIEPDVTQAEIRKLILKTSFDVGIPNLIPVEFKQMSITSALTLTASLVSVGWEGMFLTAANHIYLPGKRVNNAIKLKQRPTAELKCIDINPGEGKYEGMIGSLVLEDHNGIVVSVGSGLDDEDRSRRPAEFLGEYIEISYEQILDTYIQPVYVGVRNENT